MSVSVAADGVSQLITDCSTPLHVGKWEAALAQHPDQRFASFIVEGLRHGFRIGFGRGFPLVSSPCLFFIEAVFEFSLICVHLPGVENCHG